MALLFFRTEKEVNLKIIKGKRLGKLVVVMVLMLFLIPQFAHPLISNAETEVTRQSSENEYFISTNNGAWIGHMAHDFVNSKNEVIYCVQPSRVSKESPKLVEDALKYLPQNLITYIALGLESIKSSNIDAYTKAALSQAWVWMNVNGQPACFTDTRVDEMYSMRGADRSVQHQVLENAKAFANQNAGKYLGKATYYRGTDAEQSQILFVLEKLDGSVKVNKKTVAKRELFSLCPKIYSLAGASYHIIDNAGKKVLELVTDSEGNTETAKLAPGKYTAKEVKAPEHMALDEKEYLFEVKPGEVYTVESKDEPLAAYVDILIRKTASSDNQNKTLSLAGAEFSVEYFSTLDEKNLTICDRKWSFRTDKDGIVRLSKEYLLEGSDALFSDDNGKPLLPIGVYRISETKAPKGFFINEKVETVKLKATKGDDGNPNVSKYIAPVFVETEKHIRIRVTKFAQEYKKDGSNETAVGAHDSKIPKFLTGAEFSLTRIDEDGKRFNMEKHMRTDKNGVAEMGGLLPGVYEIREVKAPDGYALCNDVVRIKAGANDGDKLVGTEENAEVNSSDNNKKVKDKEFLYESQIGNVPITVEISKTTTTNGKKHLLKGAKLVLKDLNGNIVDRWVSDEGAHRIECIKEGKYTVIEESAPQGYEKLKAPVEIEVKNKAKMQHFEVSNSKIPDKPNTGDGNHIYLYIGIFFIAGTLISAVRFVYKPGR